MTSWGAKFRHHHDQARLAAERVAGTEGETVSRGENGIIHALVALVFVVSAGVSELRRIRKLLEKQQSQVVERFNLVGRLVPKEGDTNMPAGPFNPGLNEDVELRIAPVNAAGQPVTDTFNWSLSDQSAGTLTIAPDTLSAKLVTAAGGIDAIVTVSQTSTGKSDSASIQRTAPPRPDNAVDNFNLAGNVTPKS
jgi:hypothetical protein